MNATSGTIRRAVGLSIALVLVLAAAACGSAHAASGPDKARVRAAVMFVGDSNIGFALTQIGFDLTQEDAPFMVVDVAWSGVSLRSPDCAHCPNDFWKVRLAAGVAACEPRRVRRRPRRQRHGLTRYADEQGLRRRTARRSIG